MADSWGQGARSALPMVGDFFQQSLRARWVDPRVEFGIPRPRPAPPSEQPWSRQQRPQDALGGIINNLFGRLLRGLR
jgi:penicillin-binding protein 1A